MPLVNALHAHLFSGTYLMLLHMVDRVILGSPLALARCQHRVESSMIVHL
jgi:hypothetical protein